jgi:tetratricopeptide (TPR) repeat protein
MVLHTDTTFDHALEQLRDFSLVNILLESHKLWMHDLTRYIIRQSIPGVETASWICLALEVLFHTFPEKDGTVDERAIVDIYLPQAESLITQARNVGIPLQKYTKLIVICGVCFHDRCSYSKALEMFQIARPVYHKHLGLRNEKTLTLLHRIGWSYREQGELARSEEFFSQTLAARRKLLPPDSMDIFVSMSDLASVIERQGRLKEAEDLFEKCYESQKLALSASNQRTLAAAHNLALCFANQGRLEAAVGLCQKTLSLSVNLHGADDPGTLRTASNLAVFVDHLGRLDEALPMYQDSLTRYEKRYGYDHILTMRIRSNLAGIWRVAGQFAKAEFILREVLSELIRLLGHDHFHVCIANFDLAEILQEAGKIEEAQERYQLAIAIFEFTDPGHPVLFRMVDGLGILYREVGNLVAAATMTERAYNNNMKLLKWFDPYTLVSAVSRAEVCLLDGRIEEGQELLEKCLESFTKLLGPNHPHVSMTRNSLGCLELRKRRLGQAMRHFEIAKTGYIAVLGAQHSCVMIVQMNISRVQMELEKYDLTEQLIEHAKDGLISALGKEHPHVAVAQFYQGLIAVRRGDPREAQHHYINSIELYKPTLGRLHPNCIRAAMELLKVQSQLHEEGDKSAVWVELVEEATPILHEMGSMRFVPASPTMGIINDLLRSMDDWSASDGLYWGESSRLRWGRKTVWRDADEGTLTG